MTGIYIPEMWAVVAIKIYERDRKHREEHPEWYSSPQQGDTE